MCPAYTWSILLIAPDSVISLDHGLLVGMDLPADKLSLHKRHVGAGGRVEAGISEAIEVRLRGCEANRGQGRHQGDGEQHGFYNV